MALEGKSDKLKGKVKEVAGDITGNDKVKAEGLFDQAVGKVKEASADVKEKAEELVDDIKEKFDKHDK